MTKRILLIDSDESFAQGLSSAMNARGFAATMATNSEQGMTLARQDAPDLIVVCVEAQPTNGYMLCTRLKKDEALKGIPVILTSANATPDSFEKHKKLKTRAEEYLIKPFEPQLMLEKASALLGISLPPEAPADHGLEEEIVSIEDESLGLGDLVAGEDEPIHLSEHEVAQAHSGGEDSVVVEEVEELPLDADPAADIGEDDLKMFDQAFESLGAPAAAASSGQAAHFGGLHAVPAPEEAAPAPAHAEAQEHEGHQPTELTAPDDEAVLHGLMHDEHHTGSYDADAYAAMQARIGELEEQLLSRDAELENARRSAASSGETLKLKEAKNRSDKELLRLKEELHAKERELVELQEQQTSLEGQTQQLKDDSVKREAAAKALQQRADALAAAAKKFERELVSAREELKQAAALKSRTAELEKAHEALQKKHAEAEEEAGRHKARASELETELAGTREMHGEELASAHALLEETKKGHAAAQSDLQRHGEELQQARGELETSRGDAAQARGELETAKHELEGARAELEAARGDAAQARGELETAKHELEAARAELETAKHELESLRGEGETARHELEGVRAEMETLRTDVAALTGEKDLLGEEREELRKQVAEAQAQAAQNEDRAVKAYQKIKGDEKLREKTRQALQIALQLLDENAAAEPEAVHAGKQSA